MPSNFNSSTAQSAYWVVTGPSGQSVTVLGTGASFVRNLQAMLKLLLVTPRATYDGSIDASHVSIDGNWGPYTYKALWAVTVSSALKEIIRIAASIASGSVPRDVVQIAANLISAQFGTNAQVPSDAVTPPYRAVARGSSAPFTSRPSTAAEIAEAGANPSTLPPDTGAPPAETPVTPDTSTPDTSGGKTSVTGGTSGNKGGTTGGPTGAPSVQTSGSSISWGAVAAVAAGVVVLGVIAMSVRSDQSRGIKGARGRRLAHARANPAMHGPKMARVYLHYEPLNSGGYTRHGEYYGRGGRLYTFTIDGAVDKYGRDSGRHNDEKASLTVSYRDGYAEGGLRASDRASAMAKIRAVFPAVRFTGAE